MTPRRRETPSLWDAVADSGPTESVPTEPAALTVAALTRRIAGCLADLGPLVVEGELGPPKRAASGHVYFDLKDEGATLACVAWRSQVARAFPPTLAAGMRVRAHGKLDVYAPRGSYSFVVQKVTPCGEGELLARFELLKRELAARGWFERRRALPAIPRTIGVVTSRDGAALRDFLRTRSLRWPGFPVRLCHAKVQGPGAAEEIARAIGDLAATGVDVIVVGRGGGSLEDLWAFNEEPVARAIWECPVPVVSAVGHETDTTLSDFVADARAHTPTDAAALVIPDRALLDERIQRSFAHLGRALEDQLSVRARRLESVRRSQVLSRPERLLERRRDRLEHLFGKLERQVLTPLASAERRLGRLRETLAQRAPSARLALRAERARALRERLKSALGTVLAGADRRVAVGAATLEALSPLVVLARGYSVTLKDGRAVHHANELEPEDHIVTRLAQGRVHSRVTSVETDDSDAQRAAGGGAGSD
ncbi:Exodeoxyribonuclease 7 large subunit [Planctomycetes bacterium Pla163]|uniref:Exodeoxyribonuclease 7 large subunit n=1 Tax=Rohdeia mirabilis TaxID=2528008 RepID=A0A518CZS8_9BACT|nr:Exodeoxyribonuclease 7 large subunit [Planctomycetes bacterium Pla163]